MSWRSRAVLAATAGVGLVGAGALTAAYAAGSVPSPAPSSVVSSPSHDPQVDALTTEAKDLQGQVSTLEKAVADEPAPVQAPGTTPRSDSSRSREHVEPSASARTATPTTEPTATPTGTPTAEPFHQSLQEVQPGQSDHSGSDD